MNLNGLDFSQSSIDLIAFLIYGNSGSSLYFGHCLWDDSSRRNLFLLRGSRR